MKHRATPDTTVRDVFKEFYDKTKYQLGEMTVGVALIGVDAGLPESGRTSPGGMILGFGGLALIAHGMRNGTRELEKPEPEVPPATSPTDEL